jgi:orotate phosphoribosyltransferase
MEEYQMKEYKREFIEFLLKNNSLKFGEFTLKSGRVSPYFLNTGMLYSGDAVTSLGRFYAETIIDNLKNNSYNVIFGPAYKGIPLSITTVFALKQFFNINVNYSFNRKEVKDHGDRGLLVGKKIEIIDKIIIVDDVITAGTAVRESLQILKNISGPKIKAIVISVDRMEKGRVDNCSAIQEISRDFGIKVFSIVNIIEIIDYLKDGGKVLGNRNVNMIIAAMEAYRYSYGVDY